MSLSRSWFFGLALLGAMALAGTPALAQDELDAVTQAPRFIMKKLDPQTSTLTSYRVNAIDDSLRPENLSPLSETERKAKLDAFFKTVESPRNVIGVERVESTPVKASELDQESSRGSCYYRWRGCYGGYYGVPYYGYYGGAAYYYRPYWGYGGYYGGGYYGYGGGYYGYGYGYGYGGAGYYYPSYTLYGCGYGW